MAHHEGTVGLVFHHRLQSADYGSIDFQVDIWWVVVARCWYAAAHHHHRNASRLRKPYMAVGKPAPRLKRIDNIFRSR